MSGLELKRITDRIFYLPAAEEPLSADVGVVRGDRFDWVFDVGNNDEAARLVNGLRPGRNIVLSHFHEDHMGNMGRVSWTEVYCGSYTYRKLGAGVQVREPVEFSDGVCLCIFPLPPLHSRGALGLMVDGEYAFVGDAFYGSLRQGRRVMNAGLLKESIAALEQLPAQKLLLSHDPRFLRPKAPLLRKLQAVYSRRKPGEAYIDLEAPKGVQENR